MQLRMDKLPRISIASVPDDVRERLFDQLDSLFPGADKWPVEQKSTLPPAWVQILAEVVNWTTVFKVAATVYLAQLAKHLADDHWKRRVEIGKRVIESCGNAISRIRWLFRVLHSAQEEVGRPLRVAAAIPGPCGGEIEVLLSAADEAAFVEQLCLFVTHVEGVKVAAEHSGPDGVAWKVRCVLALDRFNLRWEDRETMQPYEQDFKLDGTPLGERRAWVPPSSLVSP